MDWARVIERNQAALTRIVAMLIAMVEMGTGGMVALLPPSLYHAVSRMLLPTESAVRRLIAIAARGLKVKPAPLRPMPKGLVFAGKGGGQIGVSAVRHAPAIQPQQPKACFCHSHSAHSRLCRQSARPVVPSPAG